MRKHPGSSTVCGEKGLSVTKLLILLAILGVVAVVGMPRISKFIKSAVSEVSGTMESQAAAAELTTIRSAMQAMMVDKGITILTGTLATNTNNMILFPSDDYPLFPTYVQLLFTTCNYSSTSAGVVHQTWPP